VNNKLHFSDKKLLGTELIVHMYWTDIMMSYGAKKFCIYIHICGNCKSEFMNISVGSVVRLPLYWYMMVFFLLRSMYLGCISMRVRRCKSYEFGNRLWKPSWRNRCNKNRYSRGTKKHHKKAEFHVLYPPPRINPNIYRVQAGSLIATRTVGKVFLKYFSVEVQGKDDFLRLRKKYYEIYFVWIVYIYINEKWWN
jgi:hypothetical protein